MDFQKIEEAVEKSSLEIKNLLFSEEIGQALQNIAEENGLDEEKTLQLIDEVGYIILGIKERSSIKQSLGNIGVPQNSVLSIIQEISREIFSKLDKIGADNKSGQIIQNAQEIVSEETGAVSPKIVMESSVPEIPPNNLPMVEEGQVVHDTPHVPQIESKALSEQKTQVSLTPARQDLAGSQSTIPEQPKVPLPDYRYPENKDPYREALK